MSVEKIRNLADKNTLEEYLIGSTFLLATGLGIKEIAGYIPRDPTLDLTAFLVVANVCGIPVTPLIDATVNKINQLLSKP